MQDVLHVAVKQGELAAVKKALQGGADVNAKDKTGRTALMKASQSGKLDVVRYLVENGADVNVNDNRGDTALIKAAGSEKWDMVRCLVKERVANVNVKDKYGNTALMKAAKRGKLDVVRCLVEERGANVNVKNRYGRTALMKAASSGKLDVVQYLVENDADVNVKDKYGNTAMMNAAWSGKLDVVQYFVENGADINVKNSDGNSVLIDAAKSEKWDVVQYLVKRGADVNVKNKCGRTALVKAASSGKLDVVRYLVENGADVNAKDKTGRTALMKASQSGKLDVVRYLVENGADVNVNDNRGDTALIKAAGSEKWDMVRCLVEERGANVNVKDKYGNTALMKAASSGKLDVVQYFVERGANINVENRYGKTALMKAASSGKLDVVQYLVENGADINVKDKYGNTALMKAASSGKLDVVRYLVEHFADIDIMNNHGNTAMIKAADSGKWDLLRYLMEEGTDVNVKNKDGNTALMKAANSGKLDVVQYLVENGADINVKDKSGNTVLMNASWNGNLNMVRYLVEERGTDVNVKDNRGNTALMKAAKSGKLDVVRYLVENSADINVKDKSGNTVLMNASWNGNLNMVRYLVEERGADVYFKDRHGNTALMNAVWSCNLDVVQYLMEERGAGVYFKDRHGNTAPMKASEQGTLDVVRYLVENSADVNVKNNDGNTAMMTAADSGKWDVVRYLVENGANVNVNDEYGNTALTKAASSGKLDVVQFLVERGANVNVKDKYGNTGLMEASWHGNIEVVQYLVEERDADVNVKDNRGNTALMKGAESGKLDVMWYLVEERGADVNFMDKYGNTALMKAVDSGKLDVVQYLVERGANVNVQNKYGDTALMWAASSGDWEVVQYLVEERGADVDIQNTKNETALYQATKHGYIAVRDFLLRHVSSSEGMVNVQSSVESLKSFLTSRSWGISPFDIEPVEYNNINTIGGEYRAKWLDADVVLRLFVPDASASTFENEVTTWLQLRHPNVIKLYGACDIGHPLFVLEYASNGSLVEFLAECERKGERQSPWKLLHEAALGLAYLHERGIIHGNLRSSNVLVGSDGAAKLSDFGLSMSYRDGSEEVVSSRAGFGSARWQAPEQLKGERASLAGDIYSFGLCIVTAVTGEELWRGDFDTYKDPWDPANDPDWCSPANLDENTRLLTAQMCAQDSKLRVTAAVVVRLLEKLAGKEASDLRSLSQDHDIMKNVDEYKDGELAQLLATIRKQISLQLSQYKFMLQEIETIHERLAQETRPAMLLEAYRLFLIDLDSSLQSGSLGNRVVALSSTRAADSNVNVFRRRIDELWIQLDASRVGDEEREHHWDMQRKKQLELFVSDVSQTVTVLSELDDEEERITLMTLLKLELDSHASKYTESQLEVMEKAYDDCCQGEWKSVVKTIPAWYLPWYELVINRREKLGEGGFGDVYRAKWLDSEVVVKEVRKLEASKSYSFASTWSQSESQYELKTEVKATTDNVEFRKKREERRKLFEQEVNVWFGLSHPHVIRLFGACHVGTPFFACEYASGGSLDKYLRKHPEDIWPKLFEAALGVQYLHSRGIVHGDLKCNNIMIGNDGKAKVTDFGLSSFEEGSEGKLSGAWQWVAPECIQSGASKLSVASDVYSLGMCIVEAFRLVEKIEDDDRPPYPWYDDDHITVKVKVVDRGDLPWRPRLCTDEQWQLVERMCAHDPDKRIKISTIVDKLAIIARGNVPCDDEEVEPEPSKDIAELMDLSKVIAEMKSQCDQFYDSATSRNGKVLCEIYVMLWKRLAGRADGTECLGPLINHARKSMLALQEEKNTVFAFTEAALRGYALHRNLDKVIEAQMWAADTLDWREKCWKLLGNQAILRCDKS